MKECPLCDVAVGKTCTIIKITYPDIERRKIIDLGFVPPSTVYVLRKSPLGDPTSYQIHNTVISLPKDEASHIMVEIE